MKKKVREDWDTYFLNLATVVSCRSTCDRLHVGAVIVNDHRILATGYNGSLPGAPHCDDIGHLMINNHCERTIHAEVNAITQAARYGISIDGASIYQTHSPCLDCFKVIAASGIKYIYFDKVYRLTEKDLEAYRLVGGYSDIKHGGHSGYPGSRAAIIPESVERQYIWEMDLKTKCWYR